MKLEQQVVTLGLAKKLKELGVKQESYFEWRQYEWGWNVGKTQSMADELDFVSAFTVAELGEMLPVRDYLSEGIVKDREDLASWVTFKSDGKWHCHLTWRYSRDKVEAIKADTEADARAIMLIYLLENKLITL